jgi:hypothetical protein
VLVIPRLHYPTLADLPPELTHRDGLRRTAAMLAYACGHLFWPHAKYAGPAEQASYARRLTEQLQGDRSPG